MRVRVRDRVRVRVRVRVRIRVRVRVRVRARGGHPSHLLGREAGRGLPTSPYISLYLAISRYISLYLLRREAGRCEADHDMVAAPVARAGRSVVPPPPAQVVLERGGAVE